MEHASHSGRQHHGHVGAAASLNQVAFAATFHCLTGCAIGEVLGMVIGTVPIKIIYVIGKKNLPGDLKSKLVMARTTAGYTKYLKTWNIVPVPEFENGKVEMKYPIKEIIKSTTIKFSCKL